MTIGIRTAAKEVGCSTVTIQNWIETGRLSATKGLNKNHRMAWQVELVDVRRAAEQMGWPPT